MFDIKIVNIESGKLHTNLKFQYALDAWLDASQATTTTATSDEEQSKW